MLRATLPTRSASKRAFSKVVSNAFAANTIKSTPSVFFRHISNTSKNSSEAAAQTVYVFDNFHYILNHLFNCYLC